LLTSAARFHLRSPLQLLLSVAGIALGVAVYVGVDVANTSATAAFETSARFVRGAATHRLLPVGEYLDEAIYVDFVAARGIVGAPIIEVPVTIGNARIPATLLGVDTIEEAAFRDATRPGLLGGTAPNALLTQPATAIVAPALATGAGTESISINTGTGEFAVRVVGSVPPESGLAQLVIADIATAQEIASLIGRLSRIDLIIDAAELRWLHAELPAGVVVVPAGDEDLAFRQLSNAFRINILALGLLALAIGMFLVYSSANFSLVRRSRTHAILHCLGTRRSELTAAITLEFLLLGLVASVLGAILGQALAKVLVDLMLFTIDDFAFRREAAVGSASLWLHAKGITVGVAATLAAAIGPIRRAVQRDTDAALRRSSQEAGSRALLTFSLRVSGFCLLLAVALLWWPTSSLVVAFAGLFAVLAAAAFATPACSAALVSGLNRIVRRTPGYLAFQASRNVLAQQSRIAVATAALTLAVACVVGVGIMIGSFRESLQAWLDTTLTSDIYVTLPDESQVATRLLGYLEDDARVEGISLTQLASVPGEYGTIAIRAFRPGARGWGLQFVDGDTRSAIAQIEAGDAIAITEPFALRSGLGRGDSLLLPGARAQTRFPIAGIYRNYDAGGAGVLISLDAFREITERERIDGIGIELRQPADTDELEREIARIAQPGTVRVSSSAGIKRISLEIFDRTFLITEVLRILAGSVAFLGMLSALMAIQVARRREFGILRSLGFDPARLRRLIMTETAIIGTSAGLLALPVGALLAALLIYVINVRSFGWTMEFQLQAPPIIAGLALALAAALLSGVLPAALSHRLSVAAALREA
ncbi:MAG TPA: FtsX-like permease family protein, partial [Gammaproteobacteria bacterium]|nr:FtsX-like permease family protein [Gammaproteobacteria bacterium]